MTDAQILEIVQGKVTQLIGVNGEWTVSRRSADDTDTLFHTVLAQSVSLGIAAAITDARRLLEAGDPPAQPQHLAADDGDTTNAAAPADIPADAPAAAEEPIALSWEPAPITVWTDLRKPVTGSMYAVPEHTIAERSAA